MGRTDASEGAIERRREWLRQEQNRQRHRARRRIGPFGREARSVSAVQARDGRTRASRTLFRAGDVSAHSAAGVCVGVALASWFAVGVVLRFPTWWQAVLYSASSAVTLVMVFALQHMQARMESATQRKLDELLRASPSADNSLIALEEAADTELAARTELNRADRTDAATSTDQNGPDGSHLRTER